MGHLVGKDVDRELGRKIDGLTTRAPWSDTLRALLAMIEEFARHAGHADILREQIEAGPVIPLPG